ncbi:unnamed protein product, partial [Effrenium voratum]
DLKFQKLCSILDESLEDVISEINLHNETAGTSEGEDSDAYNDEREEEEGEQDEGDCEVAPDSQLRLKKAKDTEPPAPAVPACKGPVDTAETQPVDDREVAQLLKMISELPTSPEVSADSKRAKFQGVRRHGLPAKQGQLTATQALPAAERATPIWRVFSPVDPADEPAATPKVLTRLDQLCLRSTNADKKSKKRSKKTTKKGQARKKGNKADTAEPRAKGKKQRRANDKAKKKRGKKTPRSPSKRRYAVLNAPTKHEQRALDEQAADDVAGAGRAKRSARPKAHVAPKTRRAAAPAEAPAQKRTKRTNKRQKMGKPIDETPQPVAITKGKKSKRSTETKKSKAETLSNISNDEGEFYISDLVACGSAMDTSMNEEEYKSAVKEACQLPERFSVNIYWSRAGCGLKFDGKDLVSFSFLRAPHIYHGTCMAVHCCHIIAYMMHEEQLTQPPKEYVSALRAWGSTAAQRLMEAADDAKDVD